MGKVKTAAASAARRSKKLFGLSMPIVESGAATAAGVFGANWITAKALQMATSAGMSWANTVWFKTAVKVAAGLLLKKVGNKVNPRWGNAMLGGALASAALSIAKRFLPQSYDTTWGLAGEDAFPALMGDTYADAASSYIDNIFSGAPDAASALALMGVG